VAALQFGDTLTSKARAALEYAGLGRAYGRYVAAQNPYATAGPGMSPTQLVLSQIIILTALGFVWAFACMGSQRSTLEVSRDDLSGDFKPVGLFNCISFRVTNVVETICCHVFMWAETASKLGVGQFGVLLGGVLFLQVLDSALIMVLGTSSANSLGYLGGLIFLGIRLWMRWKLRGDLKQATSNTSADGVYDCCSHLCCTCCAIAQEAEFVEHYEKHNRLQAV